MMVSFSSLAWVGTPNILISLSWGTQVVTLSPLPLECTFIVLDAEKWQAQAGLTEESCMTGDVNLFLTDLDDPTLGEIEVMIAGLFHLAQAPPPTITLVCGRLRVGEPVPGWGKLPCDYS
jgi:hypothetical protein